MQEYYAWNGGDPPRTNGTFVPQAAAAQPMDHRAKTENSSWQPATSYTATRPHQYQNSYPAPYGAYAPDGHTPTPQNHAPNYGLPAPSRNFPDPRPYAAGALNDHTSYGARADPPRYTSFPPPPPSPAHPGPPRAPQPPADRRVPYTGPLSEHTPGIPPERAADRAAAPPPPWAGRPLDPGVPPPPPRDHPASRPPDPSSSVSSSSFSPAPAPAAPASRSAAIRDAGAPRAAAPRRPADAAYYPLVGGAGLPQEVLSTVICDLGELQAESPRIPQARPYPPH
jgi:hypothetical protein